MSAGSFNDTSGRLWDTLPISFDFAVKHLYDQVTKHRSRWAFIIHLIFTALYLCFIDLAVVGDSSYFASRAVEVSLALHEVPPTPYSNSSEVDEGPHYLENFHKIRTIDDVSGWFLEVVMPTFYDYLNRTRRSMRPRLLGTEAVPRSPLRVRFVNMKPKPLLAQTAHPAELMFLPQTYPSYTSSLVDKETYFDQISGINVSYSSECTTGRLGGGRGLLETSFACGGHVVDFLPSWSFNDAMVAWKAVRALGMLHQSKTRLVEVMFYVYVEGVDRFVSSSLQIEITAGGSLFPRYQTVSLFFFDSEVNAIEWVALGVTSAFALTIAYSLFRQYKDAILCFGWIEAMLDLYGIFEVALIGVLVATMVSYSYFRNSSINLHLEVMQARYDSNQPERNRQVYFPADVNVFNISFWSLRDASQLTRSLAGYTCLLLFIRFLTLFRAFDALTWIAQVFERVAVRILGVLCVLFFVIGSYAVGGHLAFGHSVFYYRTFCLSFETVTLVVLGDRFEYEELRRTHPYAALVFLWSIWIMGSFLLLNFVMALLGESFDLFTKNKDALEDQQAARKNFHRYAPRRLHLYHYKRDAFLDPEWDYGEQTRNWRGRQLNGFLLGLWRPFRKSATDALLESILDQRRSLAREREAREDLLSREEQRHSELSGGAPGRVRAYPLRQQLSRTFVYDDVRRNDFVVRYKREREFLICYQRLVQDFIVFKKAKAAEDRSAINECNTATEAAFRELPNGQSVSGQRFAKMVLESRSRLRRVQFEMSGLQHQKQKDINAREEARRAESQKLLDVLHDMRNVAKLRAGGAKGSQRVAEAL